MGVSTTPRINLSMWILIYSFSDTYYVWSACGVTYKNLYGKKTYNFCNLRKWKNFNKKQLTLLKMCVTSLMCGPRADLWPGGQIVISFLFSTFPFLFFTSPFSFSGFTSFYFSVSVFNVLIFTSPFCFSVEISVYIFFTFPFLFLLFYCYRSISFCFSVFVFAFKLYNEN